MNHFDQLIESAKLEYISDTEFAYSNETQTHAVCFYKDQDGQNHVEEFAKKIKGVWEYIGPTVKQIERMFKILDETEPREPERFEPAIGDYYNYYGVKQSEF